MAICAWDRELTCCHGEGGSVAGSVFGHFRSAHVARIALGGVTARAAIGAAPTASSATAISIIWTGATTGITRY